MSWQADTGELNDPRDWSLQTRIAALKLTHAIGNDPWAADTPSFKPDNEHTADASGDGGDAWGSGSANTNGNDSFGGADGDAGGGACRKYVHAMCCPYSFIDMYLVAVKMATLLVIALSLRR